MPVLPKSTLDSKIVQNMIKRISQQFGIFIYIIIFIRIFAKIKAEAFITEIKPKGR